MLAYQHSWCGKYTHIFRTDGRVVRAKVGELVLDPSTGGFYFKTTFLDGTTPRVKHVSPLTVAALQVMWSNVDVVSDLELPEDLDTVTCFEPPPECDRLSALVVVPPEGVAALGAALQSCVQQVNHFVTLTASAPPLPTAPVQLKRRRAGRARRSTGDA
jgi:hypothetical protein